MSPTSLFAGEPRAESTYLPNSSFISYDPSFGSSSGYDPNHPRGSSARGDMVHAPLPACSGRIFTGPASPLPAS
ncbi:hypothetical protein ANO14919_094690 [Xylariales sp. No.14919]|nr:hypothetical protein ANO14919_094690 [Xylariales sp. No.14919]